MSAAGRAVLDADSLDDLRVVVLAANVENFADRAQHVQRALDNLSSLKVVAITEPPHPDDRQIVLLDGTDVRLLYDVGVRAGSADSARLPDGSVVRLSGLDRGLLSSQPNDWCLAQRM